MRGRWIEAGRHEDHGHFAMTPEVDEPPLCWEEWLFIGACLAIILIVVAAIVWAMTA